MKSPVFRQDGLGWVFRDNLKVLSEEIAIVSLQNRRNSRVVLKVSRVGDEIREQWVLGGNKIIRIMVKMWWSSSRQNCKWCAHYLIYNLIRFIQESPIICRSLSGRSQHVIAAADYCDQSQNTDLPCPVVYVKEKNQPDP